ncbi:13057_t:CDS:2, partial [Cetraspora pellucida]
VKVNGEINEISSSSVAKSSRPTAPDLVIDNNGIEQIRVSNMDYDNFTKAFQELDDSKKWVLRSGKVVEDELYKFGMSLCHSFIIDTDDKSLIEEKVFAELELMEIRTHKLNHRRYLTIDRKILTKIGYDAIDNLIREYEVDSLKKDHLESLASSSQKNKNRRVASVDSMPKKVMSRQGDLIICHMSMEYGCRKIGSLYVGYNSTKILQERGLKTPKMMKDQFDDLWLSMLLLRLDSSAGYIGRITRSKMLTIPSTISEFGARVLSVIMLS